MLILSLDPGLVTGFALLDLTHGRLALAGNALTPCGILVPAREGMPGQRALLVSWLRWLAPRVDEIAIEKEISTSAVKSQIEAVRVREVIDAELERLGLTAHYYAPSTVKATLKRLSGGEDKGLPTKAALRDMARRQLGITWPLGPDHVSDALSIGITHCAKAHGFRPAGFTVTRKDRFSREVLRDFNRRMGIEGLA